jgi:hypothetical protein
MVSTIVLVRIATDVEMSAVAVPVYVGEVTVGSVEEIASEAVAVGDGDVVDDEEGRSRKQFCATYSQTFRGEFYVVVVGD